MSKRKIVQIAAAPETKDHYRLVFALCDDGSVWSTYFIDEVGTPRDGWEDWEPLPSIPQDPENTYA